MPTIFSHIAPPLALRLGLGQQAVSRPLLVAGLVASVLPDLDVLAFRLNIAYSHALGHRGFSHSLLFALGLAVLALLCAPWLRSSRPLAFVFVGLAAVSHPLLDMITNGGLGVALSWPWSDHRFFAPWRVIEVSPLSLHRLFSARGIAVAVSELRWVWLPALLAGGTLLLLRRFAGPEVKPESLSRRLTHRPTGLLLLALAAIGFAACLHASQNAEVPYLLHSNLTRIAFLLAALFALGGALLLKPLEQSTPAAGLRHNLVALGIACCLPPAYLACTAAIAEIFMIGSRIAYEGNTSLSFATAWRLAALWTVFCAVTYALRRWAPGPRSDFLSRASLTLIAISTLLPAAYLLNAGPLIRWRI